MDLGKVADGADKAADILDAATDAGIKTGKVGLFTRIFSIVVRTFGGNKRG